MKAGSWRYAGTFLGVVATVFCVWYLYQQANVHWQSLSDWENIHLDAGWLYASFFVYLLSFMLAGYIWLLCLRTVGDRTSFQNVMWIALTSQIAKYIPGNFAHFVGKAMLALKVGISVKKVPASMAIELSNTLLAGVFVGFLAVMFEPEILHTLVIAFGKIMNVEVGLSLIRYGALAFLILCGLALLLFSTRILERIKTLYQQLNIEKIYYLFAAQVFNFILFGLSFSVAAQALMVSNDVSLTLSVGAFTIAWLAGFLALGTPGGLGVREAVLVALLAPQWGVENVLIISVMHRLLTVVGDLVAFVLGFILKARTK